MPRAPQLVECKNGTLQVSIELCSITVNRRRMTMIRILSAITLILLLKALASAQSEEVLFKQAFFMNGDSTDVRIIDVSVSPDGRMGNLTEVILNSYFFEIQQWTTEATNLLIKKTGRHSFQLHTHDDVSLYTVDRYFTFEIGLWDRLYVPLEISGTSVVVYQSGPNKGRISTLNYMPVRLPDNRSDIVRQIPLSLPGLFYGVKRIE
jgi:hypothetical protein